MNDDAGYRYKFGGMNLVNYWLDQLPGKQPDPRPLEEAGRADVRPQGLDGRVHGLRRLRRYARTASGLVIYDAADGNAILEKPLTDRPELDRQTSSTIARPATTTSTPTSAPACRPAREHMDANARPNACKLIVLMTDGLANWHNGQYDLAGAHQHIIDEANLCAAESASTRS